MLFEVRDDRVRQPPSGHVEVGVGAELTLGGDAAHGARDERGDLTHPLGVDVQVGEGLPAGSPIRPDRIVRSIAELNPRKRG